MTILPTLANTQRAAKIALATAVLMPVSFFADAATRFVSQSGLSVSPFASLENAATNIQAAVDISSSGDEIIVANGRYTNSSTINISKEITIKGTNSPENVVVDGHGAGSCFYMLKNGLLEGMTITAGSSSKGGGIYFYLGGKARNCIIRGNNASDSGGGTYHNRGGTLENCLLYSNSAGFHGGGVYGIRYKIDEYGNLGGATINNCTIVKNTAHTGGGVFFYLGSSMQNSIVVSNTATHDDSSDNYSQEAFNVTGGTVAYNLMSDASFVSYSSNDFHLAESSTAIDNGTVITSITNDLEKIPRPLDGNNDATQKVDLGCYEFAHPLVDTDYDGMMDDYEARFRLNLLNNDSTYDPDKDTKSNLEEYISGTNTQDGSSYLRLTISLVDNSLELSFFGVSTRLYRVEYRESTLSTNATELMQSLGYDQIQSIILTNPSPQGYYELKVRINRN